MKQSELAAKGFAGFRQIEDICSDGGVDGVPVKAGVYAVLRAEVGEPIFLQSNCGGHFKGQEPTVPIEELKGEWVEGPDLLYLGRSNNLRRRIGQLCKFSQGEPVGHWGGRYLWQLAGHDELIVAWLTTKEYNQRYDQLMREFRQDFDSSPFANLR